MARTLIKTLEIIDDRKNYLINGGFDFWQRSTSEAIVGSVYVSDRWNNYGDDGSLTVSRVAFPAGQTDVEGSSDYYHRSVMSVASTSPGYLQQRIEDVTTLSGKTVTLSFWATSSIAINVDLLTIQGFGSGGSTTVSTNQGTIAIGTGWAKHTLTFTVPSVSGKTVVPGDNNYLNISFTFPAGVIFTFNIARAMLNEGASVAPFQRAGGDKEADFAKCQRYYEQSTGGKTYHQLPSASGSQIQRQTTVFATEKRKDPVMVYTKTGGDATIVPVTSSTRVHIAGFGGVATTIIYYDWTADAEL